MRKARKISSPSRAKRTSRGTSRSRRRSDSVNPIVRALEEAHLDILLIERSHPADTSSPVYSPLLQPIVPPSGTLSPHIVESQAEEQSDPSSETITPRELTHEGPITLMGALYVTVILGSLLHSWWVVGGGVLIGLLSTRIMVLSQRSLMRYGLAVGIRWLLIASLWAYIGWLVCDAYMPFIIHLLCAVIGFVLGLLGYPILGSLLTSGKSKQAERTLRIQEAKYTALTTFIDSVCVSAALGYLLHSWWILGAGLLVGLILTRIIAVATKDNAYAFSQTGVTMTWLIFALAWGYVGWFLLDAQIPSIVHFLCACVGFLLGLIGYLVTYAIVSPEIARVQVVGETEQ